MKKIAALALLTAAASHGYYHFLQYSGRSGQTVSLPQRFDLSTLPARTVSYFITGQSAEQLAPGDSMAALISQIRLAASKWDEVSTSELRLQFGGFGQRGDGAGSPGIDVYFDELPPGVLAMAGPVGDVTAAPGASFIPIERSVLILPNDMSSMPSYAEETFGTLVHEFGHTLGLQHSVTSSAMATLRTRAQSKAIALAPDDIAGISILYPSRVFRSNLGSIGGRVTLRGQPAPLASVVALSATGTAIGALTHPDGTYKIEGLPPGRYYLYVHPLPPVQSGERAAADLTLPVSASGEQIQPVGAFDPRFYPNTRDYAQAEAIPVTAGAEVEDVNFSVPGRLDALRLFNVVAYSFPGQVAVRPAHVNTNGSRRYFVARGTGLTTDDQPVAGLEAGLLGGTTSIPKITQYPNAPGYLRFDLGVTEESGTGPRHLVLRTPSNLYVQPSAVRLTANQPPQIDAISAGENHTALIRGTNFSGSTTFLFDGVPAIVQSMDTETGQAAVSLPPGPSTHKAIVVAMNSDGQSSLFLQGDEPSTHFLDGAPSSAISISPSSVPEGSESAVQIDAPAANFAEGLVSVGFGSPDITARRVWVLSPTRLLAEVRVAPRAPAAPVDITVTNGLHTYTLPAGFSAATARTARVSSTTVNPHSGVISAAPGTLIILSFTGVTLAEPPRVTIDGREASVNAISGRIFGVRVPAATSPGPAVLAIEVNGDLLQTHAIQVYRPAVSIETGDQEAALEIGQTVSLTLSGPVERLSPYVTPRVVVTLGGVEHLAELTSDRSVRFTILESVPAGRQPVQVSVDGRLSTTARLTIAAK